MRPARLLTALLLAGVTLVLATPAAATDMLYPGGTVLSEGATGRPVWRLQAQCAGLFGATSNVLAQRGDSAGAEAARAQGVTFFKDAINRLTRDRDLTPAEAMTMASGEVDTGRAEGFQKIRDGGLGARSGWNVARSVCLDIADVYKSFRYR